MYQHTQTGWVTIYALAAAFGIVFVAGSVGHGSFPVMLFMAILALTLACFWSLSVSVTADAIVLVFGIGLIRMSIKLSEIKTVRPARNLWWYGYGIHGWWGKGWLLNVSGLDAVDLVMKNGMFYRIGTDEPLKLSEAIRSRISP